MSYVSIIIFTLIILLILVSVVVMAIAILDNFKTGERLRDEMARRVRFLRLDKMLSKRNIKREQYLHVETVTNIENQIRSCESCSVTRKCDEALKENSPADLSFCPNDDDLKSITNKSNSKMK